MTAVYHKPAKPSDHHSYGIMSDSPRRSSTSSFSSTDDDDMIAPCPSEKKEARRIHAEHLATTAAPSQQARPPQTERPKSWRNETSHFSPLSGDTDDTDPTALWRTMLAIQRAFGCYNSARMRAAIEMGDDQDVPVRESNPPIHSLTYPGQKG